MSLERRLTESWLALTEAEDKLMEMVESDLGNVDDVGHDYYDNSFEVYGVTPGARLTSQTLSALNAEGFARVWLNHTDGTETSYPSGKNHPANLKRTREKRRQDQDRIATLTAELDAVRKRLAELSAAINREARTTRDPAASLAKLADMVNNGGDGRG